jgi:hypothetical protein
MNTVARMIAERLERIGLEVPVNREWKAVRFIHIDRAENAKGQGKEIICVAIDGKVELLMTVQKFEQLGEQQCTPK